MPGFFTAYLRESGANHVHLLKQLFPEGQSQISQCTVQLIYTTLAYIFFGFCYNLSNFLVIIDGYYIWLCSDWAV